MIGGLLRTTSAFAIAAAAGVFTTSAMAADLGGNCCADLEERVAELEATTARKGNRRVSLTVSGHVNETLLFWDDGEETNTYVVTNENSRSRFRFVGDARINPEWSAGYLLEIGVRIANSSAVDQFVDDNTSSTASLDLRHSAWWIDSKRLGRVWLGHTSMATDGITEINLSNAATGGGNNDINNWNGGFFLRENGDLSGFRWGNINNSQVNANAGEGDRRNLVKYVSPTLHGFSVQTSWGEDDFWDAALRYAGEFNGVRVAAGVGYQQWTDGPRGFNDDTGATFTSNGDRGCADLTFLQPGLGQDEDSDVDCHGVGLSGSIMHVPTGLYVHGAYGYIEDENREDLFENRTRTVGLTTFSFDEDVEDRDEHWYVQVGIERNFFGIGKSTFWVDYFRGEQGGALSGGDVLVTVATDPLCFGSLNGARCAIADAEVESWGIGYVQSIDAAAMDLYIGYRNTSGELTVIEESSTSSGTSEKQDIEDFHAVMAGGIIRF